jgi:hypothetical protein
MRAVVCLFVAVCLFAQHLCAQTKLDPAVSRLPVEPSFNSEPGFNQGTKPPAGSAGSAFMDRGANLPENLMCFDYRRVDLRWDRNCWRVCAGYQTIKDFAKRQNEARQALDLIRQLHLTERGVIGTPQPIMEYWLSHGRAPQAPARGAPSVPIDVNSLRVEQTQGLWCVRDSRQVLFGFGPNEADARQALRVIQKYGFTRVGYIGGGVPSMIYFLAAGNDLPHSRVPSHSPLHEASVTGLPEAVHSSARAAPATPDLSTIPLGRQLSLPELRPR